MFSKNQLYGNSLPAKTLCLTFDDGPGETLGEDAGPKTFKLAEYLNKEGIRATFFVVGKFVERHLGIMDNLKSLEHIIGNHSYNHPNFQDLLSAGQYENFTLEVSKTEAVIQKYNQKKRSIFFRAPYGSWHESISEDLNRNLSSAVNYIGPINWDINKDDWQFWGEQKSADECANAYLSEIAKIGRGIILMHDSTAEEDHCGLQRRNGNRTFETIMIIVPKLKELGYRFVGLDEIEF